MIGLLCGEETMTIMLSHFQFHRIPERNGPTDGQQTDAWTEYCYINTAHQCADAR